jgi:pimeloyl-ACP methyl ester carboxylesterase
MPQLDGVEHRTVALPDLRMHAALAGAGTPVVLLHGFPQHWWMWRKLIPALAESYRVVAPDLRGAGWTDAPATGYDRDQLLRDVVALLDALDLDDVHLIGHDWGALLGYQLCLRHPDRVERYISLAGPPPFIRFDPRALTLMWRLWFQPIIAAPLLGPRVLSRGNQRLARYLFEQTADRDAWAAGDVEHFLGPLRDPARANAGSAVYRSFIIPELMRIMRGAYRSTRLSTPTACCAAPLIPRSAPSSSSATSRTSTTFESSSSTARRTGSPMNGRTLSPTGQPPSSLSPETCHQPGADDTRQLRAPVSATLATRPAGHPIAASHIHDNRDRTYVLTRFRWIRSNPQANSAECSTKLEVAPPDRQRRQPAAPRLTGKRSGVRLQKGAGLRVDGPSTTRPRMRSGRPFASLLLLAQSSTVADAQDCRIPAGRAIGRAAGSQRLRSIRSNNPADRLVFAGRRPVPQ